MRFFLPLIFLSSSLISMAQNHERATDFAPPLNIPLYLAGNYGELRSNHFHAGLDIKTQGREGLDVFSVEDGYVSRIKVSPFGYGRAIYIRHPNGYTSVYGHLQSFSPEIEKAVKEYQYQQKSFKVEMFPSASKFPVKKGDLIGISGNSGGSMAPHLHFEIRDTKTEVPLNALKFDFDIKDDVKPSINSLYIYPKGENSTVNGKSGKVKVKVLGSNGEYYIPSTTPINVNGSFGLGISAFDRLNEMPNKCGIYAVKIYQNEKLIYHHEMDGVSFFDTRYINAFADFSEKKKYNRWIHQNFVLPNNQLKIYSQNSDGTTTIPEGEKHHFRYEVSDVYGNLSTLEFDVKGSTDLKTTDQVLSQKAAKVFKYNQANSFEGENILIYLPANILYEDLPFKFWIGDTISRALAPTYNIHDLYTPLHRHMAISIKLADIPKSMRRYCLIVSLDEDENIVPEGGYWKGDYLIVKSRSFGPYTVMVDSVKPKLTPINVPINKDMSRKWSIMIKAEDNLSGVHKYNTYIDGDWVLSEFDYKKKRLIHKFEENLSKGEHHYKLVVSDKQGNSSELEFDFKR